jgi:hypothetical protein
MRPHRPDFVANEGKAVDVSILVDKADRNDVGLALSYTGKPSHPAGSQQSTAFLGWHLTDDHVTLRGACVSQPKSQMRYNYTYGPHRSSLIQRNPISATSCCCGHEVDTCVPSLLHSAEPGEGGGSRNGDVHRTLYGVSSIDMRQSKACERRRHNGAQIAVRSILICLNAWRSPIRQKRVCSPISRSER